MTAIEFNHQLIGLEDGLKRYAISLTANTEDALDLIQETYLKALSSRDKFEDHTNLKAWIFTIMKNTFINNYRRLVRENTTFDNTKDLYYLNQSRVSFLATPDSEVNAEEIRKQIDLLEDEYRIPFMMHFNGYKYKEIADHLNLNIGTVKSRIFFSRQKLMASLKN
ncbi:MAG: RNA polymerase subunit sigma [Bacteroides sp. SM23_62_1]|nr:MAG: RNA polymerase subunit sigma [Bacteroides sp. SM23_62_1]